MKIAVVGAGAMGSVYAGLLGDSGNEVWAVDSWAEHVEAIRACGLVVEGASGNRTVRVDATTDPAEVGRCELVVIATKAMDVEEAAAAARPLLGPDTMVLPIQNGLGSADRVAAVLGEADVVQAVAVANGPNRRLLIGAGVDLIEASPDGTDVLRVPFDDHGEVVAAASIPSGGHVVAVRRDAGSGGVYSVLRVESGLMRVTR